MNVELSCSPEIRRHLRAVSSEGFAAWFLATVFVGSAILKAFSPRDAVVAVLAVAPGIGVWKAFFVIVATVVLEIIASALLVSRGARRAGAWTALAMVLAFSAFVAMLLADPAAPGCGCFGSLKVAASDRASNLAALVRNAGLAGACLFILARTPRRRAGTVPACATPASSP